MEFSNKDTKQAKYLKSVRPKFWVELDPKVVDFELLLSLDLLGLTHDFPPTSSDD